MTLSRNPDQSVRPLHPRLSLNLFSLGDTTLIEDLAFVRSRHVPGIGLPVAKLDSMGWEAGLDLTRSSKLVVTNLLHGQLFLSLDGQSTWELDSERLCRTVDAAVELGAHCVYGIAGPAGNLTWEEAASALQQVMTPVIEYASTAGVRLALETSNPLRAGVNFIHCAKDALDIAEALDMGVCVDVFTCWAERDLQRTLRSAGERLALVQLSDFVLGTMEVPNRAVPGDGHIPLERFVKWVLDASYMGWFDVEIFGARIDSEGHAAAIGRSLTFVSDLLYRLETPA